jgi:hypothetical protein
MKSIASAWVPIENFFFDSAVTVYRRHQGREGGRRRGGEEGRGLTDLNEFLWRHHAFEIMFRPNFSHDFSKFLNDGAVGSCVTDGIQKEFTDRFHVREGMQSDVDVVSVGKVIETNEAREIGDAMDITGKGRALSFGGEGGREGGKRGGQGRAGEPFSEQGFLLWRKLDWDISWHRRERIRSSNSPWEDEGTVRGEVPRSYQAKNKNKDYGTDVATIALKIASQPKASGARPRVVVFTQGSEPTIVAMNGSISTFPVDLLPKRI